MLKKLGVSLSGFKAWRKRKPSKTELRRNKVKEEIVDIYNASYQNYGAPKITARLHEKGETISERTVGKYMQQIGIKAQWVKPYTRTTVNPDFSSSLKNILNEQFNPEHPNAVWCSDITYIWTDEGFTYLTSIMDLYSRKIIAWTLSKTLEAVHVADTVRKAMKERKVTEPLVIHSTEAHSMFQKRTGRLRKVMFSAIPRRVIRMITHALNHFIRLSKGNGLIVLKSGTSLMHRSWCLNTSTPFTTR